MKRKMTGMIDVKSDQVCIVYDPKTGNIQHIHHVVTLKGGTEPKPGEVEARAMGFATETGRKASQLKTLMASPEQLQPGATHRVDPKKRMLVSEPIKQAAQRPTKRSKKSPKSQRERGK